jgi:hypothetical protein
MNYHFEPSYTERALQLCRIIGALDYRELNTLNDAISARYKILEAEASKNFAPGDKVKWVHKKGNRVYRYGGTILQPGPRSKILASTGGEWTIPSAWLEKDQ